MKTKLEMAHEYAMKHIQEGWDINYDVLVVDAWQYADAMQAEADKRIKAKAEKDAEKSKVFFEKLTKNEDGSCKHFHTTLNRGECFDCGEKLNMADSPQLEWQPDWSQAPDDATYWTMRQDGKCLWWKGKPLFDGSCFYDAVGICHTVGYAPSFGYTGDWRNSLRKRPE